MLSALLAYGMVRLDFEIAAGRAALMLAVALLTQYRLHAALEAPGIRSAERPDLGPVAVPAAADQFGRPGDCGRRHHHRQQFCHPLQRQASLQPDELRHRRDDAAHRSGLGLSGQWGNVAFFAFLMACLGGLVVNRAARSDVTYAFIGFYMALVFGRSLWLGEPMTIPLHRLENGALLLFTFFMISDPRTTPNSRAGRILFALLVACGAWYVQFRLFRTNGPLWSLALFSMTVPLIDWLLPGTRYDWARPGIGSVFRS